MRKRIAREDIVFDASEKKVTLSEYVAAGIDLGRVIAIYRIGSLSANQYMFLPGDPTLGGTKDGNVITLDLNTTTGFTDDDEIVVLYDDPNEYIITNPMGLKKESDSVVFYDQTDGIMYGNTLFPVFRLPFTASNLNNTLIAAAADLKFRVVAYNLSFSGTVNAKFQSTTSSDISGWKYGSAGVYIPNNYNPKGYFETGINQLLNLALSSAGVPVSGELSYVKIP